VRRATAYVRSLDPKFSRPVWILEIGTLVNFFGTGLAYPFLLIYLHNVRGIGLGTAGAIAATMGVLGVVAGPLVGPVIDRVGGRRTVAIALVISAVGYALLPLVQEPWEAFLVAATIGLGTGIFWPSTTSLLVGLSPPDRRHTAFAVQRVAVNAGVGLGGLVGGLIATSSDATSFTVLFLLDAATFVAMLAVLPLIPDPELDLAEEPHGGYRSVVRDRVFLSVVGVNVVFIAAGYAQLELLPVFAKNHNGVSERWIGLIFFCNTATLVLTQLPVARLVEGRRRMRALALMPAGFALAWLIVLVGALWFQEAAAALVFASAAVVFGFSTSFHGPTQGALVADLAPAHLRGRYMALTSTSWEIGYVLGPALGGLVLSVAPVALWPLAALVCAASIVPVLALERRLPRHLRLTPG
jgi:MFS family permease